MSTVADIFAAAGAPPAGVVPWGTPPALPSNPVGFATGIYVVSLTERVDSTDGALADAPISARAVEELLATRPELRLDGARPTVDQLVARLAGFWFPDEVVVYIGLAGPRKSRPTQGEVANRVGEYYSTQLGANGPHAGGWPLKTLSCLDALYVHYAYCVNVNDAEDACIGGFAERVSGATRRGLHDPVRVMPFANLEFPKGNAKAHGIRGARAPKVKRGVKLKTAAPTPVAAATRTAGSGLASANADPPRSASPPASARRGPRSALNVTAGDIAVGQVRVSGETKTILPSSREYVSVVLRGVELTCRWDPRDGPPVRSGVIRVGKAAARELLSPGEVLRVAVNDIGVVLLD